MSTKTSTFAGLVVAFAVTVLTGAANAEAATTKLSFFDPGYGVRGELRATFHTTRNDDGSWSVAVTFKPHGLTDGYYNGDFGWVSRPVEGTASVTVIAQANTPVQISASGLYYYTLPGNGNRRIDLTVDCTFTVGEHGGVTASYANVH